MRSAGCRLQITSRFELRRDRLRDAGRWARTTTPRWCNERSKPAPPTAEERSTRAGVYLCGSLHLRSGVVLWLDAGATIKGSDRRDDYDRYETLGFKNASDHETSYFHYALIWGEDVEHIGIVGQGTIDANRRKRGGPKPIALKRCKHVAIQGITIENVPNYNISLLGTDEVVIDGVTIRNGYCDGIDPDCCHNVRIANCTIASVDDAIVPKTSFTLGRVRSTENVTVTNCVLATEANGLKLGTESRGDFKRIAFSNCVVTGLRDHPATSGVSLESVDGANVDGVVVSNITMVDCRAPIFLRLGNRGRDMQKPTPGTLRNVCLSNIVATLRGTISRFDDRHSRASAAERDLLEPAILIRRRNSLLPARCCDPRANARVPRRRSVRGPAELWALLPARGRADALERSRPFRRWLLPHPGASRPQHPLGRRQRGAASAPARPGLALLCDDVKDLTIAGFRGRPSADEPSLLRLVNVRSAMVTGCIAPDERQVLFGARRSEHEPSGRCRQRLPRRGRGGRRARGQPQGVGLPGKRRWTQRCHGERRQKMSLLWCRRLACPETRRRDASPQRTPRASVADRTSHIPRSRPCERSFFPSHCLF